MQKIAILGGGIGSLTTAFELTNDPNWKNNYDITIYQMGWRLGGKGASGRNQAISNRIEEHGLHIWMGFYENSFHMMRQVYDECTANNLMPKSPFKTVKDAFLPVNFTPVMEEFEDKWKVWPITWPSDNSFPGDDSTFINRKTPPTPWDFVLRLIDVVVKDVEAVFDGKPLFGDVYKRVVGRIMDDLGGIPQPPPDAPPAKATPLHGVAAFARSLPDDPTQHTSAQHDILTRGLSAFRDLLKLIWDVLKRNDDIRRFCMVADLILSTAVGMIADHVITEGFMVIENYEATEWLMKHGCHFSDSPIVRGMYDSAFSYVAGQGTQPQMGAGSMLYGALRLMLTYTGSFMWHMAAGMGETIASPIYLALRNRGVKFAFFHKVTNLRLSADKKSIDSIQMDVQATVRGGDANGYDPLFTAPDGIPCWPTQPFWNQLNEPENMPGVTNNNLESWWTDRPVAGQRTLTRGQGFNLVVLGISLGALQYICPELVQASPEWSKMLENIQTVRTQGLQLWMNRTPQQIGWTGDTPVLSAYLEPFDTWSDMSHLIPHESWAPQFDVKQIVYFCNAMPDDPNQPPFAGNPTYPATMETTVLTNSRQFIGNSVAPFWPGSANPSDPGKFDWSILVNCTGGPEAFASQFFHANIDPTERYVLSIPGTAFYRLESGKSGFDNLYLAGDWTLIDLNVGCIESTVVSGRMASQAISGRPEYIYGSFGDVLPLVRKAKA